MCVIPNVRAGSAPVHPCLTELVLDAICPLVVRQGSSSWLEPGTAAIRFGLASDRLTRPGHALVAARPLLEFYSPRKECFGKSTRPKRATLRPVRANVPEKGPFALRTVAQAPSLRRQCWTQ